MLTLRSATRKGGNFMADVGLISAGQKYSFFISV